MKGAAWIVIVFFVILLLASLFSAMLLVEN